MNPIDHKTFIKISWCVLGLLLFGGAHAQEGNCPPGYQPIGAEPGQDGPQGCAPTPGEEQQQPPVRWASRWGAITTDAAHSSSGASFNQPSREAAEQAAIENCHSNGGSACKVELTYTNGCVAMALGDKNHNEASDATMESASRAAMKVCSKADTNCHVVYTSCSPPVRIQ